MSVPSNFMGRDKAEAYLQIVDPPGNHPIIKLKFNPEKYVLKKDNNFAEISIPGLESPPLQYVRGGSETLTIDKLVVDTSEELKSVREKYVDGLRNLLKRDDKTHAPPIVEFVWAHSLFRGVVTSLEVAYVLFDLDGTPLRAEVKLALREYQPIKLQSKDSSVKLQSPDVEKRYVVRAGETLSSISASVFRNPAHWREIARANAITDPRRVAPGTVLTIPRLAAGHT